MEFLDSLKKVALVVIALVLFSWVILYIEYDSAVSALLELFSYLRQVVERLFRFQVLFSSLYLVIMGLAVLVMLSTLSAWLQVEYGRYLWRSFDLILFFPSIIPIYIYGISIEVEVPYAWSTTFFSLPIVIALGNGLWWWWHRQFVNTIKHLKNDKPAVGIANMGLSVKRYYLLPEFRRSVWERVPEMFLWVLVNTLFLEAAIPRVGGVVYDLVFSLSDGQRSVEWIGVVAAVFFIGLMWLIIRLISDHRLSQSISYSSWGMIRGRLVTRISDSQWTGFDNGLQIVALIPLAVALVACHQALIKNSDYWELIALMSGVSFVVYLVVIAKDYRKSLAPVLSTEGRQTFQMMSVVLLLALCLIGGPTGKTLYNVDWGFESVGDNTALDDEDDDDIGFEGEKADDITATTSELSKSVKLFRQFWLFGIPSVLLYLASLTLIFLFFFSAHYRWKGGGWSWWAYSSINEVFGALSRVPPYLLLVVTVFWLGFQTFDGCTKQFTWVVALFFVLLPTQLLAIDSWIQEASNARFIVARRSVGVSAVSTFGYLVRNRWLSGLFGLVTFALGLVLLMDISMIWLLGERGTFTCKGDHWLDYLREENVKPYEAIVMWLGYPFIMYFFVRGVWNSSRPKVAVLSADGDS